jgi:hypothetical protein
MSRGVSTQNTVKVELLFFKKAMSQVQVIDILIRILSVYACALIVLGTFGNLLVFVICLSKDLRSKTTFKFLAFMAVSDIFAVYGWNLDHFTNNFYNSHFNARSLAWCRFEGFCQYVSLQFSAWILVGKFVFQTFIN